MEYLILNDASIPFINRSQADDNFPVFLKIINQAFKANFKAIRVEQSLRGWFETPLCSDYTLREWLNQQDKDKLIKIKSLIDKTQTPYIPNEDIILSDRFDLSSSVLASDNSINTSAIGAAFLLNQLSLSYNSSDIWNVSSLDIKLNELSEGGETTVYASVLNCSILSHWELHLLEIEEQRKKNSKKATALWINKEIEFPNLIFCGNTKKQLECLSVSDCVFNQLWNSLKSLDEYCNANVNYSLLDIKITTMLNISNESTSVHDNPKFRRLREFKIDDVKTFFGLHIKNFGGNFRLHFYPLASNNKIYIGYFGKHLPTKNNL